MSKAKKNYNGEYKYIPINYEQEYIRELIAFVADNLEHIGQLQGPYRRLSADKTYQKPHSVKKRGA